MTNETTLDTYLLRRAARIAMLARIARPFRARLERRAAVIFGYAREAKQMRLTLDEIVEEARQEAIAAEYAAHVSPEPPRHAVALAELWRVCAAFGAGRKV